MLTPVLGAFHVIILKQFKHFEIETGIFNYFKVFRIQIRMGQH